MAAFNKFNIFTTDLTNGVHNFGSHTFKWYLTNTAVAATDASKAAHTEVANGNGYTTGGNSVTISKSNASGVEKITTTADPATWTCVTAPMGTFRYAVLYNVTAGTGTNIVGWYDYGSSITLQVAETFTLDLDQANGIFTVG